MKIFPGLQWIVLVFLCFVTGLTRAQDVEAVIQILDGKLPPVAKPEKPKESARPSSESVPIFHLRDRSRVAGVPRLENLLVRTRYGVLSIPRNEILRVRFVRRVDPEVETKVSQLIEQLGDEDFDTRENAMDALRKVGSAALPLVRAAASSDNEEVKNRAEILVEELEEGASNGGGDSLPALHGTDDEIVTTRMRIKGRIEMQNVTISSRYGDLLVNIADLHTISFRRAGPAGRKLDVQPTFQPPGNWLDTKLTVEKGQKLRIEASGTVSVARYGMSSGPTGTRRYSGSTFKNFAMLSLVGKVGKKGEAFLVGNKYRGKAKKGGKLYLGIVAFRYDPGGAVGKFNVKVSLLEQN